MAPQGQPSATDRNQRSDRTLQPPAERCHAARPRRPSAHPSCSPNPRHPAQAGEGETDHLDAQHRRASAHRADPQQLECRDPQCGASEVGRLKVLPTRAAGRQRWQGIASNDEFAGVHITGQMGPLALEAGWRELSVRAPSQNALKTPSQLLVHPSAPLERHLHQDGFGASAPFAASSWSQREWNAVRTLNRCDQSRG